MDHMKYIIMTDIWGEMPVIFHASITHSEMFQMMKSHRNLDVVSAGFIVHSSEGVDCYGRSVTLGAKARPEDSALVSKYLGVKS